MKTNQQGLSNRQRRSIKKLTPVKRRAVANGVRTPGASRPADAPPVRRDGLEWLIKKKRLTPERAVAAMFYRGLYRDAGPVSIASSLGALDRVDQGARGVELRAAGRDTARRQLLTLRGEVLRGQVDMLTALDGVAGVGHCLRELTGGDRWRADELEAALKIALDLVHDWRLTNCAESSALVANGRTAHGAGVRSPSQ